jgi:salicylate hydroxylase
LRQIKAVGIVSGDNAEPETHRGESRHERSLDRRWRNCRDGSDAREGWQVTVCEAAPAPAEVGAGLQMSPNATKVLRWLGVLDAVAAQAFQPRAAELRDGKSGAWIYRTALGAAAKARWGAPYLHVHRVDLLAALTSAARESGAVIRGGAPVASYALHPEGPVLKLAGGDTLRGDLVIGADGIRSALRAQLNGPEDPDFSGQIAWRGTIPAERLPKGLVAPDATVWAGPGRHLVTYYLRGGSLVNFVAVEERDRWTAEGWSAPGDPDELRRGFAGLGAFRPSGAGPLGRWASGSDRRCGASDAAIHGSGRGNGVGGCRRSGSRAANRRRSAGTYG